MDNNWHNWPNTDALALIPRGKKTTTRALWLLLLLLAVILGGMMSQL
jgi:hypothetical protein